MPLRSVPLPEEVAHRLPSDRDAILFKRYDVDASRWQRELKKRAFDLPAGPLGSVDGRITLTRTDVMRQADVDPTPQAAMDLLWYSLAWGLGTKASRLNARLDALARDPSRAADLVTKGWLLTRNDASPAECYNALLTDRGRPRIPWLGASFATKVLYFAHGTMAEPRNLILDRVVATRLGPLAWANPPTTAWCRSTYGQYCELMHRWATEASERAGRRVLPDEIEGALFLT